MTMYAEANKSCNQKDSISNFHRVISLRAIFAGGLASMSISFLFNLFNIGVGLSILTYQDGSTSLGVVSFIWLAICAFITMFFSGYIAGRISGSCCQMLGLLHGFLAWSFGLLLLLIMLVLALGFTNSNMDFIISQPFVSILTPSIQNTTTVSTETAGYGTLGMFFIFLIGALSSCAGGYMSVKKNT